MNSKATSFAPKVKIYQSDGTGRDSYVCADNGGSIKVDKGFTTMDSGKFPSKAQHRNRNPSIPFKVVNYYGDGRGRDYFVMLILSLFSKSNGGLNKSSENPCFINSLRDYDKLPEISVRPQSSICSRQKNNCERLSTPKISINPYDSPAYFWKKP